MDTLRRVSCIVAVSLVVSLTPIRLARRPLAVPSSIAASGSLHETPTPLQGQERQGPLVILRVRALVPEKVKLSDPVQRTVRATVLTIDEESKQMKVQTVEGQQLMLYLDPASRARLYVGAPCLLQVAQQSMQDFLRPSAHGEAFW